MIIIKENGPALAWMKLVSEALGTPGSVGAAVVEMGVDNGNVDAVKSVLDPALKEAKFPSTSETQNTIFPTRSAHLNIEELESWYRKSYLPKYRARKTGCCKDTYFARLVGASSSPCASYHTNQLKFVIDFWNSKKERGIARPRKSALQLSVFIPHLDHSRSGQKEFPCLQQLGLTYGPDPISGKETMRLQAFYPRQFLYKRCFGNYLGIIELGRYIASQTGEVFGGLTCFVGDLDRDANKSDLRVIIEKIEAITNESEG